jgi:hypothetical protein
MAIAALSPMLGWFLPLQLGVAAAVVALAQQTIP